MKCCITTCSIRLRLFADVHSSNLKKAEARAHILEGLRIALDHIDEVIALIRSSSNSRCSPEKGLIERFSLSHDQAQAILDMRLQRLTGLERERIENEYNELYGQNCRVSRDSGQ